MAKILVIDDQPIILEVITHILDLAGHDVVTFSDPLLALDYCQTSENPMDLVLTDIEMPSITGFALVNELNRTGHCAPILFMSGYPPLTLAVAESFGNNALLEKPFTASQLRDAVTLGLAAVPKIPMPAAV